MAHEKHPETSPERHHDHDDMSLSSEIRSAGFTAPSTSAANSEGAGKVVTDNHDAAFG